LSRSVQYASGTKNMLRLSMQWQRLIPNAREYEKIAVVFRIPQTTQNLVISRSLFEEDGKEMFKDL